MQRAEELACLGPASSLEQCCYRGKQRPRHTPSSFSGRFPFRRLGLFNGLRDHSALADFLQSCEDSIARLLLRFRPNRWKTKSSGCLSHRPANHRPSSNRRNQFIAGYRTLAAILDEHDLNLLIWIRNRDQEDSFRGRVFLRLL